VDGQPAHRRVLAVPIQDTDAEARTQGLSLLDDQEEKPVRFGRKIGGGRTSSEIWDFADARRSQAVLDFLSTDVGRQIPAIAEDVQ